MSPWLAVALAVAFGASVKAITGMGLPPVAIPVMAAFVGIEDTIVIMALPMLATNMTLIFDHREHRHANPVLVPMVVAVMIGGFGGSWLLTHLDTRLIAVLVAALVAFFVIGRSTKEHFVISRAAARRLAVPVGFVGGVSQGATGLSGPILATFLHAQALPPMAFVFSIAMLFQFSAVAQVAAFTALGRYDARLLGLSVLATILALGVMLAVRPFAKRISAATFDRLVLVVLTASAAKMLFDSFA